MRPSHFYECLLSFVVRVETHVPACVLAVVTSSND